MSAIWEPSSEFIDLLELIESREGEPVASDGPFRDLLAPDRCPSCEDGTLYTTDARLSSTPRSARNGSSRGICF